VVRESVFQSKDEPEGNRKGKKEDAPFLIDLGRSLAASGKSFAG
jgi:hypothetical protein